MTPLEIETKLQQLRLDYKRTDDPDMRRVIVAQAKALKISLAIKGQTNLFPTPNKTYEEAKSIFG